MAEDNITSASSIASVIESAQSDLKSRLEDDQITQANSKARNEDFDVEEAVEEAVKEVMPPNAHIMCIVSFIIFGNATLFFWNALLNCVFDVIGLQYSSPDFAGMSDYLTAVNNTFTTVVSIVVLWWGGSLHRWMMYTGFSALAVSSVAFGLIVQFTDGNTGYALHLSLQVLAGSAAGMVESALFAFACVLPRIYAGWASFGMGVSGIFSFAVYMLFSEVVFDRSEDGVKADVWVNMTVSAVLTCLSLVFCMWLFSQPWAAACINKVQENNRRVRKGQLLPGEEVPQSYWALFKQTWLTQINVFAVMWLSLFIFPNVGPLAWGDDRTQTNTVMGMFQVGDFCGRYIPNMASFISFVMIPRKILYPLTYVRLVFFALFVVCMQWPNSSLWGNFALHIVLMLTMAITSGWYLTLSMIYAPGGLERAIDKNKASGLSVVFLLLGICCGLWMAKIFQVFPDPHL